VADLSYQPKFEPGDTFTIEDKYLTVMDVRDEDEVEYQLSINGRIRWKSSALIDRDAKAYHPNDN